MDTNIGLEVFLTSHTGLVKGKRVGLVASAASVDRNLVSIVERLNNHPDVTLAALFGPEHGLRGEAQAGHKVANDTDALTGLPAYSLYGDTKKPTAEMLEGIDVFIIDMQDGGVRFYTYLYTMAYVMEAASEAGLPVIVLDRPTPLGGEAVEGPVLEAGYESFVGLYAVPIRPGMTTGELAQLFNDEFGIGCDLTVIWMANWQRAMWFDQTGFPFIAPSPNLPTLDSLTVYPGTCLIEGTNLSEGRGTTKPFEYIGAPWITEPEKLVKALNSLELPGVRFRPVYFTPTFSKHTGEPCQGMQVFVTDRASFQPVDTALHILLQTRLAYPTRFEWREPWDPEGHYPIDLLTGGSTVRQHVDAMKPVSDLVQQWQEGLHRFKTLRAKYLHYTS